MTKLAPAATTDPREAAPWGTYPDEPCRPPWLLVLTLISLSAAGIAGLVGYVALNGDFLCSVSKRLSGLDAQHAVDLVVPVAFVGFVVAAFGRRAPRLLLVDLLMTTG